MKALWKTCVPALFLLAASQSSAQQPFQVSLSGRREAFRDANGVQLEVSRTVWPLHPWVRVRAGLLGVWLPDTVEATDGFEDIDWLDLRLMGVAEVGFAAEHARIQPGLFLAAGPQLHVHEERLNVERLGLRTHYRHSEVVFDGAAGLRVRGRFSNALGAHLDIGYDFIDLNKSYLALGLSYAF